MSQSLTRRVMELQWAESEKAGSVPNIGLLEDLLEAISNRDILIKTQRVELDKVRVPPHQLSATDLLDKIKHLQDSMIIFEREFREKVNKGEVL